MAIKCISSQLFAQKTPVKKNKYIIVINSETIYLQNQRTTFNELIIHTRRQINISVFHLELN